MLILTKPRNILKTLNNNISNVSNKEIRETIIK